MEDPYKYVKFALMPYASSTPVVPYTPFQMPDNVYMGTHQSSTITVPVGSQLEIWFVNSYTTTTPANCSQVAFFYQVITQTTSVMTLSETNRQVITGLPSEYIGGRYIGGYFTINHLSGLTGTLLETRYGHGGSIWLSDTKIPPVSRTITAGSTHYLSCIPTNLEYRYISKSTTAFYAPGLRYGARVKNNTTGAITLNVSMKCWMQSYELSSASPVIFEKDSVMPYKLAEYLIGNLRNNYLFMSSDESQTALPLLTSNITTTLQALIVPWQQITSDVTINVAADPVTEPEPGPDSDEEWGARPMIWNP